jgi:hypothetical protein
MESTTRRDWLKKVGGVLGGAAVAPLIPVPAPVGHLHHIHGSHGLAVGDKIMVMGGDFFDTHVGKVVNVDHGLTQFDYAECEKRVLAMKGVIRDRHISDFS